MDQSPEESLSLAVEKVSTQFDAQLKFDPKTHDTISRDCKLTEAEEYAQFPVQLVTKPTLGRCLIARKDVKCGEILLKDVPIFMSPNAGGDTCLGCCIQNKSGLVPCSKCGWPVCGPACEMVSSHSGNECLIFSKSGLKPPLPSPYCFIDAAEYVKVLRVLGLPEKDPGSWEDFQKLESHQITRSTFPTVRFMSTLVKGFIRGPCALDQVPEERIDFILGAIDVNAFRHTVHPNNPLRGPDSKKELVVDRNATFLYPKGSMAAHSCRRNARWETLEDGSLEMWAAEDIRAGELITHPYVDLMQATPDRRRQLRDQFYFDCSCERCSSRTELGTNFSTLKCPECGSGDLLANNPLDYESFWSCVSCSCVKPWDYERDLLIMISSDKKAAIELIQYGNNLAVVAALARILGKYRGKLLHPNHASVVDVEYHLVKRMALLKKPTVDLLQEMRKMIHKFLDIAVVFYPGIK